MGDRDDEDMGWDSLFLLNHNEKPGAPSSMASHSDFSPYPLLMESENPFHPVRFPSDSKHSRDRSEGISELVGSLVHPESAQISNPRCPSIYTMNEDREPYEMVSKEAAGGSYSHGKRRLSSVNPPTSDKREITGEKRPKMENSDLHNKPAGKGAKDNSVGGEAPKENFIHVRARRGQATNSHSLAERVRREKISERMRLLQELVPGCNKITGKAVMLDEIINYVQSLQQQVEFLSMKLATVYPELNLDFERALSKDILHPRTGNEAIARFGSGFAPPDLIHYGTIPPQSMAPPFAQTESDDEIRSLLRVGFNRSLGFENLG